MSHYLIKVKGQLDDSWSEWFDNFLIEPRANGETWLKGQVADQPALHGLLKKLRDLSLPILLVEQINANQSHMTSK